MVEMRIIYWEIMTDVFLGFGASWRLESVEVTDQTSGKKFFFPCNQWLSNSKGDSQIIRELTCDVGSNNGQTKSKYFYNN